MKIVPTVLVLVGVVFLLFGSVASAISPLQIIGESGSGVSGSGGGGSSYYYSWSLSGSLSASASTINSGQSITLTIHVTSYSSSSGYKTNLEWDVNNNIVYTVSIGSTGTWQYTYNPSVGSYSWSARYISVESSSSGTHYSSFGSGSFTVNAVIHPPTVTSVSSSSNPSTVGQGVTFSASVSWNGNTGSITWYVNGNQISSNIYTFTASGTYTVEAYAQNSAGSNSQTMSQLVNSAATTNGTSPGGTNSTDTNLANVGSFYYSLNGNNVAKMTNSLNYTITITNASVKDAFYYVMNDGTTKNALSYYLSIYNINTGTTVQLQISESNTTTIDGYTSYYVLGSLQVGQYKITGFVVPLNGNPAINVVTSQINVQVPPPIPVGPNYIDIAIGTVLVLVGLIFWRKLP